MKNTGIEYSSADRTPVVLPEMEGLLPPLTGEQLDALESDLLKKRLLLAHHRQRRYGHHRRPQPLRAVRKAWHPL